MSKKAVEAGTQRGRGRPASLPPGTRNRTIRLTDPEYAAVMAFVAALREREKRETHKGN